VCTFFPDLAHQSMTDQEAGVTLSVSRHVYQNHNQYQDELEPGRTTDKHEHKKQVSTFGKCVGFVGKTIRPADNRDLYDTLAPMWMDTDTVTPNERALVYALCVLDNNYRNDLDELTIKMTALETEKMELAKQVQALSLLLKK